MSLEVVQGFAVIPSEPHGAHHFRGHKAGTQLFDREPEGKIRVPGHGRKGQAVFYFHRANLQHVMILEELKDKYNRIDRQRPNKQKI